MCSLHPLRLIEGPLTLSFNAIIPACHLPSTYPDVCLAVGRCSELLISFNQLISAPSSIAYNAPMWRGVKSPLLKPFMYTHPDFQRSPVALSFPLRIRPIYYHSFITMTWHTFSDYASKAWLKGMVGWKVTPLHPSFTGIEIFFFFFFYPRRRNLCQEIL